MGGAKCAGSYGGDSSAGTLGRAETEEAARASPETCGTQPHPNAGGFAVTSRGARLGVVLRQAQWEIDQIAFRMPRGEVSAEECYELAHGLEEVARELRVHVLREDTATGKHS